MRATAGAWIAALLVGAVAARELPRDFDQWAIFPTGQIDAPAEGVVAYDIVNPLFSDHADKQRFVKVPSGTSVVVNADGTVTWPVGTTFAKTFAYGARAIETRILTRDATGWKAWPYVWDDNQKTATLKIVGAWVDTKGQRGQSGVAPDEYRVPNVNQCKQCHQAGGELVPIGPIPRNIVDVEGVMNQLRAAGVRIEGDTGVPAIADWRNADETPRNRARAYVDAQCAHCHSPGGSADNTGLDLRWSVRDDAVALGIWKSTVSAGKGTFDRTHVIIPGRPEDSIMMWRIRSVEPGVMMPEIGRRVRHVEGEEIIRKWIAGMKDSG